MNYECFATSHPKPYWNSYWAGFGLGLVLLASFVIMGRGLGASGAFTTAVATAAHAVAPAHAENNAFYAEYLGDGSRSPLKDWLVFEVLGVFVGGFLSGVLANRSNSSVEKGPRITTRWRLALRLYRRRADGHRRQDRAGLHQRPGADRRRAAQRGQLGLHVVRLRRRLRRGLLLQKAMDLIMNAPFYKFGLFGDEASFIIAFVIGIGFGFFLERAGFGSGRKLAAQFYLRDLSVLKVMFTAIITAMTGLYLLSRFGMVDLSLVYLVPTFLVPQIVGGLLLGFGFVIGGYCPGTSCVSAATGRIDGMVYLAGMIAGLVGFAEFYPYLGNFPQMTSMGQITLARFFNLPYGLLVFAVVLMALGAFMAAEWAEKKFGGKEPDPEGSLIAKSRRLTPVRILALGLLAAGLVASVSGDPYRGSHATIDTKDLAIRASRGLDSISAADVADWIIQGRDDFKLIDLRNQKDFDTYHIPTAENVPLASLTPDSLSTTRRSFFVHQTVLRPPKHGSCWRRRDTRVSISSKAE